MNNKSVAFLALSMSMVFGTPTLKSVAQTVKMGIRSSASKASSSTLTPSLIPLLTPPTPVVMKPGGPLNLVCGEIGPQGMSFPLAQAIGGKQPYTMSVTSSDTDASGKKVPFSFTVDQAKGLVAITDSEYTSEDTAHFDVSVTDSNQPAMTKNLTCSIGITPSAPGALYVGCPGPAYVNTAFDIATVSGGQGPFTYSIDKAADTSFVPPLALDSSTGVVTGASTSGTVDVHITVTDKTGATTRPKACTITVYEQPKANLDCSFLPLGVSKCVGYGAAKNVNINTFWTMNGGFVFFNQVKAIYNQASNSETVATDIGTLNFPFGMQLNIGSNIQAGSVPPVTAKAGTIPTLSPSASAQAAQNMLYGGTIYASGAYPLVALGGSRISDPGRWGGMFDLTAREGVDLQNFKAGASIGADSPSTHTSVQLEGYLQVNSTNLTVGGGTFAGALFLGGSYGYSYTSHDYIRDYGIASANNRLGQLSAGFILNGVAKIGFSKAFGPSQTYFDGTVTPVPTDPTTVNNFKRISFEISYQSAAPGSK